MKILPVEDELFHDRRVDRYDETDSRFRNFVTAPRKG